MKEKYATKKDLYVVVVIAVVLSVVANFLVGMTLQSLGSDVSLSPGYKVTGTLGSNGDYFHGFAAKLSSDDKGLLGLASYGSGSVINSVSKNDTKKQLPLEIKASEVKINGDLLIPFSNANAKGKTQLSASGFLQEFSESGGTGSINIGGDNIIMRTQRFYSSHSTDRESSLSPTSVSFVEDRGRISSTLTHEYIQFSQGNFSIYCYPNFITKTLDCK